MRHRFRNRLAFAEKKLYLNLSIDSGFGRPSSIIVRTETMPAHRRKHR